MNQGIDLMEYIDNTFQYSYHCHEATLLFAYALNKAMSGKFLLFTRTHERVKSDEILSQILLEMRH